MAYERYGFSTYKYGSSDRLYGVPGSPITNRLWSIEIDRDNDGVFNGDNEAMYCIGMDIDRGFLNEFDDKGAGYAEHFAPPMVGKCTLTMENHTGRYDLWTGSGAPSTDNLPGRKCRIRVREGYTGTDRDVFFGFVKDITNDPNDETATIVIHDGVEILQERRAQVTSTASSDLGASPQRNMLRVLDDIGWEYGYNLVDNGSQSQIGYFYCDDTAYRVIHNLTKVEENLFYVNAAGQVAFDEVTISTAKASSNTYGESLFLKPVYVSQPWENVFTKLRRVQYSYSFGTTDTVVWSKEESQDVQVAAGGTYEFTINYRYDDSTVARYVIQNPFVASSDIVTNTATDGSGTDLSSLFSATLTDLGTTGLVTVSNSSTDAGYVTSVQARGTPLYWRKTSQDIDIDNWAELGEKVFVMDSPYNESLSSTLYDQFVYLGYPHRTKQVRLKLRNQAEQFVPDINELMYFDVTKPYLTSSGGYNVFRVMRIRHKWMSRNGQDVETEWTCRSAQNTTAPIST